MTSILVTRAEPDAGALAAQISERGWRAVVEPLIRIEVFKDTPLRLEASDILAFTSANGVRAFAQCTTDRANPVFAVGPATAQAARDSGFGNVETAGGDVDGLVALIQAEVTRDAGEILHVSGADAAGDLCGALKQAGYDARRTTLYKARAVDSFSPETITAFTTEPPTLDWVCLFSPRTARIFERLAQESELIPSLGQVGVACLSPAVADALRNWSPSRAVVAREPETEALLDAISDYS